MFTEFASRAATIRKAGYAVALGEHPYNDARGLTRDGYSVYGYNEVLPRFRGRTLINLIQGKVDAYAETGKRIRVLDLGCGPDAFFLTDCVNRWGPAIEGIGVGARITTLTPEKLEERQQMGITILQADLQDVHEFVELGSVDIAVACKSFPYLADPFRALMGLNSTLKEDGIALISDFPLSPLIEGLDVNIEQLNRFHRHLQSLGIEINLIETANRGEVATVADLAFKKIPNMNFPLQYTGKTKDVHIQLNGPLDGAYLYKFQALIYCLSSDFGAA